VVNIRVVYMPDDLNSDDSPDPKKAPQEIMRQEIAEGMHVFERSGWGLFISALSAGLDIGFSLFLMAVMRSKTQGHLSEAVVEILVANAYTIGFIFVVVGRSELFTEQTTLAVLPLLDRRVGFASLGRLWITVYIGNLIGATAFAALAVWIGPTMGSIKESAFGTIAHHLTDHSIHAIFLSAVLAGWLMGLLSWLVSAARDTISQVVIVWLVALTIGLAGLHHVIAGTVEVLSGAFAGQGISAADFGKFLLWATLGNIVGGVLLVAIVKYGHARARG
jgi:formate/nitrite transporter FocA (FNT family)